MFKKAIKKLHYAEPHSKKTLHQSHYRKILKIIRNLWHHLMGRDYCDISGVRPHTVSEEPVSYNFHPKDVKKRLIIENNGDVSPEKSSYQTTKLHCHISETQYFFYHHYLARDIISTSPLQGKFSHQQISRG
jgi:hypothetical protein